MRNSALAALTIMLATAAASLVKDEKLPNRIQELALKSLKILDDPKLTPQQKNALVDPIEAEITSLRVVEARRKGLNLDDLASASPSSGYAPAGGAFIGKSPTLVLTPDEQVELFKSVQSHVPIEIKAATTSADIAPASVPAQYVQPILAAREPTRVLDLIPSQATDRGSIDYYVTTGTAAAAPVAEGADKPESGLVITKVNAGVTKIAHWTSFTEEAQEDFAPFAQILSNDMIAGVISAENAQLLNGTGTGASKFKGLLQVAGTQSYVRLAGDTILDALEIGGSQLRVAGRFAVPTAYVMHPTDYSKARRTKTTQGSYIAGDPTEAGPATLWGYPVVLTSQMPVGKALVGDFAQACQAFIRAGISYRTNANGVGFRSNKIEVVAEERLALAVVAPAALSIVTISDPA